MSQSVNALTSRLGPCFFSLIVKLARCLLLVIKKTAHEVALSHSSEALIVRHQYRLV